MRLEGHRLAVSTPARRATPVPVRAVAAPTHVPSRSHPHGSADREAAADSPRSDRGLTRSDHDVTWVSNKVAAILRGCFPTGVTESQWQGSVEETAERHLQALKLWYPMAEGGNSGRNCG